MKRICLYRKDLETWNFGIILLFLLLFGLHDTTFAKDARIVFFGTGKRVEMSEAYSEGDLRAILAKIAMEKPSAVVFDGDLIQGLEQSTSPASLEKLKNRLHFFHNVFNDLIGPEIPLYPVMGNHTFVNTEAVKIFREEFKIEANAPLEPYQLAYTATVGRARLIVLATGLYEIRYQNSRASSNTMPLLDWLEKTIRSINDKQTLCFVVSHEPAFSPRASEGIYSGIDQNNDLRDRFWNVLRDYGVRAYFCSHESVYDRSQHKGVWQLVSGGIVQKQQRHADSFPHFLVLTIPEDPAKNPRLKAIDLSGKAWDEFELLPAGEAVQHLRITQN